MAGKRTVYIEDFKGGMRLLKRVIPIGLVLFLSACSADVTIRPADTATPTPVKPNTVEPSIAIDALSNHFINLQNAGAFLLVGSCSIENASIAVSSNGVLLSKSFCQKARWSTTARDFRLLPEGQLKITVALLSTDGGTTLSSDSVDILQDTAAPVASLSSSVGAVTTATTSAVMTFSASDVGSGIESLQCKLDGEAFSTCSSPRSLSSLASGAHIFSVKAVDKTGNVSAVHTASWTIDASTPSVIITSAPPAYTNSTNATFRFTGSGGAVTYLCMLNGGTFQNCTSPAIATALGPVAHTFFVKPVNALGTEGPTVSVSFTVDLTPPVASLLCSPVSQPTVMTFSASDVGSAVASLQCRLDSETFANCPSPRTLGAISDGQHSFSVRAIDSAGNESATQVCSWTSDSSTPNVIITSAPSANINSTSASFSFTGSGGAATYKCKLDGAAFAACTSPSAYTSLGAGNHIFQVKPLSAFGKEGSIATASFTVDLTAPTITIISPSALAEIDSASSPMPTVTGTCSENGRSLSITSGGITLATATCQNGGFTSTSLDLSSITDGTFTLSVSQSDLAGNLTTITRPLRKYSLRNSTLTPVVIPPPTSPKFKVVFIVDNSNSMGDEQQYLASGVRSLMNRFKNADGTSKFDVDFFIHTTSSSFWATPGEKPPGTYVNSYSTNDVVGGGPLVLPSSPVASTSPYNYYTWKRDFPLLPPYNGATALKLVKGSSSDVVQNALISAITNIGTTGDDEESGLCTMGRILVDSGINKIVSAGDKVAFVVLSDTEDDASVKTSQWGWNYCWNHNESTYRKKSDLTSAPASSRADSDWQNYAFQGHHYWYAFDYDYQYCPDGVCGPVQTTTQGSNLWAYRIDPTAHGISTTLCPSTPQTCPATLPAAIRMQNYTNARNCRYSCSADNQAYENFSTLSLPNPKSLINTDFCTTGFSLNQKTYSNVQDYIGREKHVYGPGTCSVQNYKYVPTYTWDAMSSSTTRIDEILRATPRDTFPQAIRNGLQTKLGSDNYIVTALINDDDIGSAQCRAQAEGTGKKYREFVNSLGGQGSFHSICDTDYYQALEPIKTFFEAHVQVEFSVTLAANESISSVSIRRAALPLIVLSASDFSYASGILKIRNGLVQAGDVLELVIRKG